MVSKELLYGQARDTQQILEDIQLMVESQIIQRLRIQSIKVNIIILESRLPECYIKRMYAGAYIRFM